MLLGRRIFLVGVLTVNGDVLLDTILRSDDVIVVDLLLELFDLGLAPELFILRLLFDLARLFIHFNDALQ